MKIGMKEHIDVTTGVQDEVAISFETNAVAFYATINGLAKDKIGYPIRELSTNAWDASRGNFEVHLPTSLNPVFRVRDFGPGMSADAMKNVYSRLYSSTKRWTNNQVGGWGLGSKSPYAYLIGDHGSGSYNVTSYHEGMMRTYVLSLEAGGKPVMRMLVAAPSNEPSGMDVSFAVRREDIQTFVTRAHQILWSFNPRPTITPSLNWDEPEIQASGDGWTSYKKGTVPFSGPHVRMGCVMYPFDLRQVETSGFLDIYDTVLFEAPIGSLKVTLSREELAFDDTTKATLKGLVASYEQSMFSQIQAKVDASTSLFEAVYNFEQASSGLGPTREHALQQVVTWNGMKLYSHIGRDDFKTCQLPEGWSSVDRFEDTVVRTTWAKDAAIVIEHNPCYSIQRFAMANLVETKVLWVRCKRIHRAKALAALGNPENVIDLDTFKVPVEARTGKTTRKRRTLVVSGSGVLCKVTQGVDLAEGGVYIEEVLGAHRYPHKYIVNGRTISEYDLDNIMKICLELGVVEQGQIFLVQRPDSKDILGDQWSKIDLVDDLKCFINVGDISSIHDKTVASMDYGIQKLAKLQVIDNAPEDIKAFHQKARELYLSLTNQGSRETTVSDKAYSVLKKLNAQLDEMTTMECPIEKIGQEYDEMDLRYPLLHTVISNLVSSWRGEIESTKELRHYFELLARPSAPSPIQENGNDGDMEALEAAA